MRSKASGQSHVYLLDSDAAKSLCQYLLLDELAFALGCPLSDFAVLPQLRFQLRLNKPDAALKKLGSQDAVVTAQRLVEAAAEVQVVTDSANTILELNRPDIDSGEAILFAAVSQDEDDSLITGDKRALIALSEISAIPIVDSLWEKIITLEEAVYLIVQRSGFDLVSQRVRARPDVNVALSVIFGRANPNKIEEVLEGLNSYMNHLQSISQGKYLLPY
ncbi:hypothetical protein PS898_01623 [Pseudomonas fluorescens]|nr:hypothetical protein PS898_01623 [Pseudomonas fluorescens]